VEAGAPRRRPPALAAAEATEAAKAVEEEAAAATQLARLGRKAGGRAARPAAASHPFLGTTGAGEGRGVVRATSTEEEGVNRRGGGRSFRSVFSASCSAIWVRNDCDVTNSQLTAALPIF
jgi:hypothetical protein